MSVWHSWRASLDALAMCLAVVAHCARHGRERTSRRPRSTCRGARSLLCRRRSFCRTDRVFDRGSILMSFVASRGMLSGVGLVLLVRNSDRFASCGTRQRVDRASSRRFFTSGAPAASSGSAAARPLWSRASADLGAASLLGAGTDIGRVAAPCWCSDWARRWPLLWLGLWSRETLRPGATRMLSLAKGEVCIGYCADRNRRAGTDRARQILEAIVVDASGLAYRIDDAILDMQQGRRAKPRFRRDGVFALKPILIHAQGERSNGRRKSVYLRPSATSTDVSTRCFGFLNSVIAIEAHGRRAMCFSDYVDRGPDSCDTVRC